ncbi:DUF5666 domain-containing protein, partial [Weissella cibaria]|uniref:DUF5666 domain-containing protein n=1 Tax=Weissella cibaria TaxID=137591 RepID=UPI00143F853E
ANSFASGNVLNATKVECKPDALSFAGSATGTLVAEMEGFVTSVSAAANSFTLGEQQVTYGASTTFEGGTALDIQPGVKLDARGTYNLVSRILDANRIRFRQTRFRIEAPAQDLDDSDGMIETLGLSI